MHHSYIISSHNEFGSAPSRHAVDEESNPFLASIVGKHERDRGTVPRQHTVLIKLSKRKRVIVLSNARGKPRCCFFCTGTSPHCSELRHPLGQVQFGDGVQMNLHDHNTQQSLTYVTESCARSTASEKYKTIEQTSSGPSASLRQRMPAYLTLVSPLSSHDKLKFRQEFDRDMLLLTMQPILGQSKHLLRHGFEWQHRAQPAQLCTPQRYGCGHHFKCTSDTSTSVKQLLLLPQHDGPVRWRCHKHPARMQPSCTKQMTCHET